MAKESEELPVTPELTKPHTVETRRFSAGKAASGNIDEKTVPHYLRASTGSCHDICKYGRKHVFEGKESRAIPDRATRKQLHQSSEESIGGIITSVSRLRGSVDSKPTKVSNAKLRESIDSEHQNSDASDTNEQRLPTKSFDSEKQIGKTDLANRKKTSLVKFKPSLLKSHTSPTTRQEISSTSQEVRSLSKSTSKKVETQSKLNSKKVETPSKSTSKAKTSSKSPSKVKTLSKSTTSKMVETSSESSSLKGKEMKLSEKRVTSLNPNSASRKTISSMNSPKSFGGQRNTEIKMANGASHKAASRKLMAPLGASLSPRPSLKRVASLNSRKHKSLKIVSHLKNQRTAIKVEPEEHRDNEVEEKTLYVIKMESGNKNLQSDQNATTCDDDSCLPLSSSPKFSPPSVSQSLSQEDREESEYTSSEFEEDSLSGNHEHEYTENGGTLEAEAKGKLRKDRVSCSEDKDSQMLKLRFRRGKVVENQVERNSPRRLRFRRAKLLEEKANAAAAAKRKSFKRGDEALADGGGVNTGPEKVVLRHQDKQDKKDAQGLFNNVIEETASKLAETRKSKVKALVGAFETVISLQEKKPPANTVT